MGLTNQALFPPTKRLLTLDGQAAYSSPFALLGPSVVSRTNTDSRLFQSTGGPWWRLICINHTFPLSCDAFLNPWLEVLVDPLAQKPKGHLKMTTMSS